MRSGIGFVEAVMLAAGECSQRIFDRELRALQELEAYREQQRDEARAKRETEEAERRSKLEARATLGQKPTLKTSLGDLLAARRR
jgi:type I site-specific restriction endonuclease